MIKLNVTVNNLHYSLCIVIAHQNSCCVVRFYSFTVRAAKCVCILMELLIDFHRRSHDSCVQF